MKFSRASVLGLFTTMGLLGLLANGCTPTGDTSPASIGVPTNSPTTAPSAPVESISPPSPEAVSTVDLNPQDNALMSPGALPTPPNTLSPNGDSRSGGFQVIPNSKTRQEEQNPR